MKTRTERKESAVYIDKIGEEKMIRVDRAELTRNEIIRVAANRFLNEGYTKTTVASMAKALSMSTGNMTFTAFKPLIFSPSAVTVHNKTYVPW